MSNCERNSYCLCDDVPVCVLELFIALVGPKCRFLIVLCVDVNSLLGA